MGVHVAELWRYPVKSMAGERLERAMLGRLGLPGDRLVHVEDAGGRLITARTHPGLLDLRAGVGPDGEPTVDGRPWTAPEAAAAVRRAAGPTARLVRNGPGEAFDVLPVSVLTDGAVAALGVDHRRLRPTVLVAGVDGPEERTWPGRRLGIGAAVVGVRKLRGRCVMTTYDPDTQVSDPDVLRRIVSDFGGRMALDCWVIEPGMIAVGDPVHRLA
jgi:uncharacterized protein YcbX